MENSEIRERIISLGKALVEELGLEPGVDTLARWMAHYIAEQITIAENTTGDEKSEAEERCFETVLKLWQYRSSLPDGRRPLENFEPIFRALERLDPEASRPFYYSPPNFRSSESDDSTEEFQDDVLKWTQVALGIDRMARVLIDYVFRQAALNAVDEKTLSWLKNATDLPQNEDLSIVVQYLPPDWDDQEEETLEKIRQEQIEGIESKIEKLDAFVELSNSLRAALTNELEELSKEDTSKDDINDSK
jgi:hypothetical protein